MLRERYLAAGGCLVAAALVAAVVALAAFSGGGGAGTGDVSLADTGGTSEGIAVHGHWEIEVREPDGALVSRQEFENALVNLGKETLAKLLARDASTGLWAIEIRGENASPCDFAFSGICQILEPATSQPDFSGRFKTLTVSQPSPDTVQLSGNFTATQDGGVDKVTTRLFRCAPSVAPGCSDASGVYYRLASSGVSPVIDVLSGQQVLVKVTISFS